MDFGFCKLISGSQILNRWTGMSTGYLRSDFCGPRLFAGVCSAGCTIKSSMTLKPNAHAYTVPNDLPLVHNDTENERLSILVNIALSNSTVDYLSRERATEFGG